MPLGIEDTLNIIKMLRGQPPEAASSTLRLLPPDVVAHILREFSFREREEFLRFLPERDVSKIRQQIEGTVEVPSLLLDEILRGNCVMFLGAGISAEAGMPTSSKLVKALQFDPVQVSLDKAAQEYETNLGSKALHDALRKEFERAAFALERRPKKEAYSYQFIANTPQLTSLIVTTNFDHLLEDALRREGLGPVVIRREQDLTLVAPNSCVVVKIHGDIDDRESMVITQSDYARLTDRVLRGPGGLGSFLATLLTERTMIFVGFQMADRDFQLIRDAVFSRMRDAAGRRTLRNHYAVLPWGDREADVLERQTGIEVIRAEARQFFEAVFKHTSQFVNREGELREICQVRREPFVEITGPAGAGKSALLTGIETHYRIRRGYNAFLHVSLGEDDTPEDFLWRLMKQHRLDIDAPPEDARPETLRKQRIRKLVENLKNDQVLITIDETEKAPAVVRWLDEEVLRELKDLWRKGDGEGRIVFAGRQPFAWLPVTRLRLYSLRLSPFEQDAVEEMVRKYHILRRHDTLTPLERRRIAREILRLTGTGHAGLIKLLIDEITALNTETYPSAADLVNYLRDNAERLIRESLVPELQTTVLRDMPAMLLLLLQNFLCVFRVLNSSMLEVLRGYDLSQIGIDESALAEPEQIVDGLRKWRILTDPNRTIPFYQLDPVVGFLLSSWLWRDSARPSRYAASHRAALAACEAGFRRSPGQQRLAYGLEGLYHFQCLRAIGAEKDRQLVDQVRFYLGELEAEAPDETREVGMRFRDMVSGDRDLRERIEEEFERSDETPSSQEENVARVYTEVMEALDEYIEEPKSLFPARGVS